MGDVGNALCPLLDGNMADVRAVYKYGSRIPGEQAQHTAEQGAFSHAVGAENGQKLAFLHPEADVLQDLPFSVGEAQIFYFNRHSAPPFL